MIEALNLLSGRWLDLMWRVTWQGAIFIALMFLVTRLCRRLSPTIKHVLWMLVIAKFLIMPFAVIPIAVSVSPPAAVIIPSAEPPAASIESVAADEVPSAPVALEGEGAVVSIVSGNLRRPINWPSLLLSIWLAGIALLLCGIAYRLVRLKRDISAATDVTDAKILNMLRDGAKDLGTRTPILKVSGSFKSPLVCGILRPTLIFPEDIIDKFTGLELKTIINHELAHIKRLDIATNWLQIVAQVLYFFNPLVWYVNRQIRLERESACDDWVLERGEAGRDTYSDALMKVMELCGRQKGFALGIVGVSERFTLMARRLKLVMDAGRRVSTRLSVKVIASVALVGLVGMPAYAVREPEIAADADLDEILRGIEMNDSLLRTAECDYTVEDVYDDLYISSLDGRERSPRRPGTRVAPFRGKHRLYEAQWALKGEQERSDWKLTFIHPDGREDVMRVQHVAYDGERTTCFNDMTDVTGIKRVDVTGIVRVGGGPGNGTIEAGRQIRGIHGPLSFGLGLRNEMLGKALNAAEVSLAGTERIGESDCYILEVSQPSGWKDRLWIDPATGFRPLRIERYNAEGKVTSVLDSVEWRKVPDTAWFPTKAVRRSGPMINESGQEMFTLTRSFTTKWVKVNAEIPDEHFVVEFPEDASVVDKTLGVAYRRWGDKEKSVKLKSTAREEPSGEPILRIEQDGDSVHIEIRNADIRDVAKRMAEVMGRNIAVEDTLTGVIGSYGPRTVPKEQLPRILRQIVRPNRLRTSSSGEHIRIDPPRLRRSRRESGPMGPELTPAGREGYRLEVAADGSFSLHSPGDEGVRDSSESSVQHFGAGSEEELADRLDEVFGGGWRPARLTFDPPADSAVVAKLEELMHDRNYTLMHHRNYTFVHDIRGTGRKRRATDWSLHKNKNRIQIFLDRVQEIRRNTSGTRWTTVVSQMTGLGAHVQSRELRKVNVETHQVTLRFDEEGRAILNKLVSLSAGEKLSLSAEGVTICEGEVPMVNDAESLIFTFSPEKLKRFEHAFEMSKLEGKRKEARSVGNEKGGLSKKAQKTNVTLKFANAPLQMVIRYLSARTGVNIAIDDRALPEDKPARLTLELTDVPLAVALDVMLRPKNMGYHVSDNHIFISTQEGIKEYEAKSAGVKESIGLYIREKRAEELVKKLSATMVTLNFDKADLKSVISYLATITKVNLVLDDTVFSQEPPVKVTCSLRDIPLLEAMNVVLLPRGFDYCLEGEHIILISTTKKIREYRLRSARAEEKRALWIREGRARKLFEKGRQPVSLNFSDADLRVVFSYLGKVTDIKMVFDEEALSGVEAAGVNCHLRDVSLLEAIGVILRQRSLDYVVREDSILITTEHK